MGPTILLTSGVHPMAWASLAMVGCWEAPLPTCPSLAVTAACTHMTVW